jgi:hypothetical protein
MFNSDTGEQKGSPGRTLIQRRFDDDVNEVMRQYGCTGFEDLLTPMRAAEELDFDYKVERFWRVDDPSEPDLKTGVYRLTLYWEYQPDDDEKEAAEDDEANS